VQQPATTINLVPVEQPITPANTVQQPQPDVPDRFQQPATTTVQQPAGQQPAATLAGDAALDAKNRPWDKRIHGSGHRFLEGKVRNGEWAYIRSIDMALVATVEAELDAMVASTAGQAPNAGGIQTAEQPVTAGTVIQTSPAGPGQAQQSATSLPSMPGQDQAPGTSETPAFMTIAGPHLDAANLTVDQLNECMLAVYDKDGKPTVDHIVLKYAGQTFITDADPEYFATLYACFFNQFNYGHPMGQNAGQPA
jgi:hypothetical protein